MGVHLLLVRRLLPLPLLSALALAPGSAGAAVPHTVQPGETLWSIAAASNFTTRTVAAYNGLSPNGNVILGSTVLIPSVYEGSSALQRAGLLGTPQSTAPATPSSAPAASAPVATSSGPAPEGAYTVRLGDTLSALAARSGVPLRQVAAINGLSPEARIVAGTSMKLPSGSPIAASAAQQPVPAAPRPVAPAAAPYATPGRMTSSQIGSIASSHGVPGSLAAAVAYEESGFNNSMISSTSARGIMQIMPGTWSWLQQTGSGRLDPWSPTDNVRAGSIYLNRLLQQTGGDVPTAVAGYYQGLGSVRSRGMFDDTKRYVANVLALRHRFGG
jgi:soluble lytic murein transglycosylase-like protein